MSKAIDYGDLYYCVKVPIEISEDGEIYVWADKVAGDEAGSLLFLARDAKPLLVLSKGNWLVFFAASVIDGRAVAVEHWKGEVTTDE